MSPVYGIFSPFFDVVNFRLGANLVCQLSLLAVISGLQPHRDSGLFLLAVGPAKIAAKIFNWLDSKVH